MSAGEKSRARKKSRASKKTVPPAKKKRRTSKKKSRQEKKSRATKKKVAPAQKTVTPAEKRRVAVKKVCARISCCMHTCMMLYAHMYSTYRAPYNLAYLTGFDLEYKRWLIGNAGKNPTKKKTIVQPIKNSLAMKIVVMFVVVVIYLLYSYGYLSIQIMCCYFSCLTNLTRSL